MIERQPSGAETGGNILSCKCHNKFLLVFNLKEQSTAHNTKTALIFIIILLFLLLQKFQGLLSLLPCFPLLRWFLFLQPELLQSAQRWLR